MYAFIVGWDGTHYTQWAFDNISLLAVNDNDTFRIQTNNEDKIISLVMGKQWEA